MPVEDGFRQGTAAPERAISISDGSEQIPGPRHGQSAKLVSRAGNQLGLSNGLGEDLVRGLDPGNGVAPAFHSRMNARSRPQDAGCSRSCLRRIAWRVGSRTRSRPGSQMPKLAWKSEREPPVAGEPTPSRPASCGWTVVEDDVELPRGYVRASRRRKARKLRHPCAAKGLVRDPAHEKADRADVDAQIRRDTLPVPQFGLDDGCGHDRRRVDLQRLERCLVFRVSGVALQRGQTGKGRFRQGAGHRLVDRADGGPCRRSARE